MADATTQLDYAPAVPAHQRRWFRRALVIAALLCLAYSGFMWGPRTWRRVELLSLQRQCMAYTRQPTHVVYEPDRERGAALWVVGGEYVKRPPGGVLHLPPVAAEVGIGDSFFLHARRRPDGGVRLVNVTLMYKGGPGGGIGGPVDLGANVYTPMTFTRPLASRTSRADFPPGPAGELPRLYSGQPDPNDAAHFTIKYEYTDRTGVIEGWLDDNDDVVMKWREDDTRPTTRP